MDQSAFIFPGQGKQKQGMSFTLYQNYRSVKRFFAKADEILPISSIELLSQMNTEQLSQPDMAQLAVGIEGLAITHALREHGIYPAITAGFSAGEWTALAISGVLTEEEIIESLLLRGSLMKKSVGSAQCQTMAAIIGVAPEQVVQIISDQNMIDIYPANFNSPRQIVVSGTQLAVNHLEKIMTEQLSQTFRFVKLNTAGAFHSPFMKDAENSFNLKISSLSWKHPLISYINSVSGIEESDPDQIADLMSKQMSSSVQWIKVQESIQKLNPDNFIECGTGKVLSSLWKQRRSSIPSIVAKKLFDQISVSGKVQYKEGEGFYSHHFPGFPTVPGTLIVESFLQLVKQHFNAINFEINSFKFNHFTVPGECTFNLKQENTIIKCSLFQNNKQTAAGTIAIHFKPNEPLLDQENPSGVSK